MGMGMGMVTEMEMEMGMGMGMEIVSSLAASLVDSYSLGNSRALVSFLVSPRRSPVKS